MLRAKHQVLFLACTICLLLTSAFPKIHGSPTVEGYDFDVETIRLPSKIKRCETLTSSITIINTGDRSGIAECNFIIAFPNETRFYYYAINSSEISVGGRWDTGITWKADVIPLGEYKLVIDIYAVESSIYPDYPVKSLERTFEVYDSLIISGNEVHEIKNCKYNKTGDIIIRDAATLIVSNATLFMEQEHDLDHSVTVNGSARLIVERANISSNHWLSIYLYDQASLAITDSDATCGDIWCYENSVIDIANSTVGIVVCRSQSKAFVQDSDLEMNCWVEVDISTIDSTIRNFKFVVWYSNVTFSDLQPGKIEYLDLNEKDNLNFTFRDTEVENWSLGVGENAAVSILNSKMEHIELAFVDVNATLHSLARGYVSNWNLYRDNTIEKSYSNVTRISTFIESGWAVSSSYNSTVSISVKGEEEGVYNIGAYSSSELHVSDSALNNIHCWDSSVVFVKNTILRGNIFCWRESNVAVTNVTVTGNIECYDSSSVSITNSTMDYLKCVDSARLSLTNTNGGLLSNMEIREEACARVNSYLTTSVIMKDVAVEGAKIQIYASNSTFVADSTSDSSGVAKFLLTEEIIRASDGKPQAEYVGNYTVEVVYKWFSKRKNVALNLAKSIEIEIPVYHLTLHFVDIGEEVVKGLLVELCSLDLTLHTIEITNNTGHIVYTDLIPGNYTMRAQWFGVCVKDRSISVSSDTYLPLQAGIYDFRVKVFNERYYPISDVRVELRWENGTDIESKKTGKSGVVWFENLPSATYVIEAAPLYPIQFYHGNATKFELESQNQEIEILLESPFSIEYYLFWSLLLTSFFIGVAVIYITRRYIGRSWFKRVVYIPLLLSLAVSLILFVGQVRQLEPIHILTLIITAIIIPLIYTGIKRLSGS